MTINKILQKWNIAQKPLEGSSGRIANRKHDLQEDWADLFRKVIHESMMDIEHPPTS